MVKKKRYEVVEECPFCEHENVWDVPLAKTNQPIRVCQNCGKKIFICSECEDLEKFCACDWHENPDGSRECSCGRIEKGE